jgi:hypothetical protein
MSAAAASVTRAPQANMTAINNTCFTLAFSPFSKESRESIQSNHSIFSAAHATKTASISRATAEEIAAPQLQRALVGRSAFCIHFS